MTLCYNAGTIESESESAAMLLESFANLLSLKYPESKVFRDSKKSICIKFSEAGKVYTYKSSWKVLDLAEKFDLIPLRPDVTPESRRILSLLDSGVDSVESIAFCCYDTIRHYIESRNSNEILESCENGKDDFDRIIYKFWFKK